MYIKRFSMVWFLSIATMGLFSCASGGAELETTSLHRAIRETAANIEARLEGGTKIALLNFSSPVSGEVSGESAQVIGRKLGAQAVVSGSLTQSRGAYRFRVKTLTVETAVIAASYAADISGKDGRTADLLEGVKVQQEAPAPKPASGSVPTDFVFVQGGTFTMGSPSSEAERNSDETQHQVTVSSFYLGKYEVTQKEMRGQG